MATTVDTMIDRILNKLRGNYGMGEIDVLNGSINDTETSLTSTSATGGIRTGAVIEIDSELMLVTSVSGTTVNIRRGINGSTAATHTDSTLIYVSPRFPRQQVLEAQRDEIRSWDHNLYQEGELTFTVDPDSITFEFDLDSVTDFIKPLALYRENSDGHYVEEPKYRVIRASTSDFASGYAIKLPHKVYDYTSYYFLYAAEFDLSTFTTATDLEATVGLSVGMLEIVEYGSMYRLTVGMEARRVNRQNQGQSRDAREVREGAAFQTSAGYRQLAMEAKNREVTRLLSQHPMKIRR